MSGIGITRLDLTAAELCAAVGQSRDAKSASRMLALALVLEDEPSSCHWFERDGE